MEVKSALWGSGGGGGLQQLEELNSNSPWKLFAKSDAKCFFLFHQTFCCFAKGHNFAVLQNAIIFLFFKRPLFCCFVERFTLVSGTEECETSKFSCFVKQ
jgi:hypothetical protein